jgi:L-fucose isomerase-like protein
LTESVNLIKEFNLECEVLGPVIDFKNAKELRSKGVNGNFDFVVLLVMTWTEVADMFYLIKEFLNKPVLLWSHTMWEAKDENEFHDLGAFAATGVVRKTLKDFDANFKFIYGMPKDEKIKREIHMFIKTAKTIKKLNFSRIGLIGAPSMGMYTGWQDPLILEKF